MSGTPGTGWLTYSLLRRLLPPVFFHHIWTEFVHTKSPYSPQLIEELNQAAEQLVTNNDVENACQVWLICAALESRRGNNKKALKLTEKTSEFAQNYQLPKILEWSNWGASSLCARRGNWQQATRYLQSLQEVLNNQGEWMLAGVISILETNLYQLVIAEQGSFPDPAVDPQLAVILEQFLQWETPNLTTEMTPTAVVEDDSLFKRFWRALKNLFKGKTRKQPAKRPFAKTSSRLPTMQSDAGAPPSKTRSKPDTPTDTIPADKPSEVERPQTEVKSQPAPPTETDTQPEFKPPVEPESTGPSLTVYCLGTFRVYQDEKPVEEWPSVKGKLIFKYLLIQRRQSTAKEVLMEQFWPDFDPDAARNNLNVAIYGLRQALRSSYEAFSHILFQDDHYLLNPKIRLWVDFEVFLELCQTAGQLAKRGDWSEAVQNYQAAVSLYQGELFAEDRYEEWIIPRRQHLQDTYLKILDHLSNYYFQNEDYVACIETSRHILEVDSCRENAHRRLMRCYCRQGQYYLGIRQYHQCEETLRREFDVEPSPKTTRLYQKIRRHESI